MPHALHAVAAAALLSLAAAPVLAQPPADAPASGQPETTPPPPAPSKTTPPADQPVAASAATAAGADASVTTGMTVKDKTGAAIGQVTEVKTGADGKTTATIKMGGDVFAVETDRLAVAAGAATINASQADIKNMLKK